MSTYLNLLGSYGNMPSMPLMPFDVGNYDMMGYQGANFNAENQKLLSELLRMQKRYEKDAKKRLEERKAKLEEELEKQKLETEISTNMNKVMAKAETQIIENRKKEVFADIKSDITKETKQLNAQKAILADKNLSSSEKQAKLEQLKSGKPGETPGSLSFEEGAASFGKGLVRSITGLFTDESGNFSLSRTATTVGIGVAAGLVALAAPVTVPIMVGAGLTLGTIKAGKGISDLSDAKTKEDAKEAWQEIGEGTAGLALSLTGIKAAGAGKAAASARSATLEASGAAKTVSTAKTVAAEVGEVASTPLKARFGGFARKLVTNKEPQPTYTEAVEATTNTTLKALKAEQKIVNKAGKAAKDTAKETAKTTAKEAKDARSTANKLTKEAEALTQKAEQYNGIVKKNAMAKAKAKAKEAQAAEKAAVKAEKQAKTTATKAKAKPTDKFSTVISNLKSAEGREETLAALEEAIKLLKANNQNGKYTELLAELDSTKTLLVKNPMIFTNANKEAMVSALESIQNASPAAKAAMLAPIPQGVALILDDSAIEANKKELANVQAQLEDQEKAGLYVLEMLPLLDEAEKIGYTPESLNITPETVDSMSLENFKQLITEVKNQVKSAKQMHKTANEFEKLRQDAIDLGVRVNPETDTMASIKARVEKAKKAKEAA